VAVTYNLKGTSNPYFKIGKSGSTLFQGTSDPSGSYSVENGDVWFDTSNGTLKFRSSGSWSGITTASDLVVTGDLTVQGTTTTVNSSTIDVQNSLRFEGATSDAHETILTVEDPTQDNTITIPDETGTIVTKDSNTGAIQIPVGTTAQRPASPSQGMIRYNTTTNHFEGYDGSAWIHLETQYG